MERAVIERWVRGVVLFGAGFFILFSLFTYSPLDPTFSFCRLGAPVAADPANFGGKLGSYLSGLLVFLFGGAAYVLVFLLLVLGWHSIWGERTPAWARIVSVAGLLLTVAAFFSLAPGDIASTGGFVGFLTGRFLAEYFGSKGMYMVLAFMGIGFLGVGHRVFISPIAAYLETRVFPGRGREAAAGEAAPAPAEAAVPAKRPLRSNGRKIVGPREIPVEPAASAEPPAPPPKPAVEPAAAEQEPKEKEVRPREKKPERREPSRKVPGSDIKLPSVDLLKIGNPTQKETKDDLDRCAQVIEETLSEFGIEGEIVQINQGPRVTMYELQLAPGIQVQKVNKIQDNIAMSLKTTTLRIVAPLPGKSTVGIEVPNRDISVVYLREIISSKEFTSNRSKLSVTIGKDIMGRPIVGDLKGMPHLLIAGATGSGKTVCINSLIASILYKATPEELKFLMIDPKMVELTFYNDLPHMLLPVVVEIKKAVIALKWLIGEMERRYKLFSEARARNIESYNENHKDEALPYIVVVIDELADLMIIARNEIENSIIRLAQLSRAAGIHLILATQRPSVNVITGIIKANLPCRIAFQVPSKFDSRTIIDTVGAEKLLGRGDLLFVPPGSSRALRIQGSYIADEEIEALCAFFRAQKEPEYRMEILDVPEDSGEFEMGGEEGDDDLYNQAKRLVIETKIASISMIQRRLKIGFNRAARMIEKMEEDGVVGPYREGKPREVYPHPQDTPQ